MVDKTSCFDNDYFQLYVLEFLRVVSNDNTLSTSLRTEDVGDWGANYIPIVYKNSDSKLLK